MSDIMKSIPFGQLMEWILNEYKKTGQVFGIQKAYVADQSKTIEIFGRKLENPVGPAAGPHTQPAESPRRGPHTARRSLHAAGSGRYSARR